jgi:hypothetical protein
MFLLKEKQNSCSKNYGRTGQGPTDTNWLQTDLATALSNGAGEGERDTRHIRYDDEVKNLSID